MEILENLSNILESILFAAGNPVPVDIIAEKLGVSEKDVKDAAKKIAGAVWGKRRLESSVLQ